MCNEPVASMRGVGSAQMPTRIGTTETRHSVIKNAALSAQPPLTTSPNAAILATVFAQSGSSSHRCSPSDRPDKATGKPDSVDRLKQLRGSHQHCVSPRRHVSPRSCDSGPFTILQPPPTAERADGSRYSFRQAHLLLPTAHRCYRVVTRALPNTASIHVRTPASQCQDN